MKNKLIWLIPILFLVSAISVQGQFSPIKITGNPIVDYIITDEILNGDDPVVVEPLYGRHDVPNMKKMRGFPGIGTTTEVFEPVALEQEERSNDSFLVAIFVTLFAIILIIIFFYVFRD